MEKIKLSVNPREGKTPNQLRREGIVPATLYGPGQPSESVQLNIAGKSTNAVIRDVQRRSTTHQLLHIEFYRVSMDRLLTMTVPLKFINSSPAAAEGGQLVEVFQSADIESLPGDIPEFIEVDLSVLKAIDDAIHFGDLKLAPTVKLLNPHDEIVAKVVAPRAAEEEAPAAAAPAEGAAPAAETPEAAKEE
jgi:large subunit ribosomal protein L25